MTLSNAGVSLPRSPQQQACEPVSCDNCGIYQFCLPLGLGQADLSLLDSVIKRKEIYKETGPISTDRRNVRLNDIPRLSALAHINVAEPLK